MVLKESHVMTNLPKISAEAAIADLNARSTQSPTLLTTKEAASFLNVSAAFFERDRWAGKRTGSGPLIPYVTVGNRAIRYRLVDLQAHVEQNLHGCRG
jgi:hypothetical protein